MTFRTPLTSVDAATSVDTGAGAKAGVRVYQTTDGRGNAMGVIELDDGITGDTPSTISVGSFGALGGGALSIIVGSFAGIIGPRLDLEVDQAGQVTAQLTAPDGMLLNGSPVATFGQDWIYVVENNTFAATVNAAAFTILPGHSFTITPPAGMELEVEWKAPRVTLTDGGEVSLRLVINGGIYDSIDYSCNAALKTPARLTGAVKTDGTPVTVSVQGKTSAGTSTVQAITPAGGYVMLRYVLR